MEKYSKLSFIMMITLLIFIIAFAFRESDITSPDGNSAPEISASEVRNSRQPISKDTDKKYFLILKGNTLLACHIESGVQKTLEQAEIEISSLTPQDIQLLENGVYAGSEEELFLYFESYTS